MTEMIRFSKGPYVSELPGWSKHHPWVSTSVKVEYANGNVKHTQNETLKALAEDEKDSLLTETKYVMNKETRELENATVYYLPLDNLDYPVNQMLRPGASYETGTMNTSQTTYIRFFFLVDDARVALDYYYHSKGSGAPSMYDHVFGMRGVEDILEDMSDSEVTLEANGIEPVSSDDEESEEGDIRVVAVNDVGTPFQMVIDHENLANYLIGVEMYDFDQHID